MLFPNVLLTGAAGRLGGFLRTRLAAGARHLRSTDRAPLPDAPLPNETFVPADLADPTAAPRLVEGIDAAVHFGAIPTEADFESIAAVNILGTQRLYEAARRAGVRRFVFASSNHATGFYRQTEVIDASAPVRPDSHYGLSKAFGEALAQLYFDKWGIETVSIRIGSCLPAPTDRRHLRTWLSPEDLWQIVERALSVPRVGHTIVFGASDNAESFWDNRLARPLGYRPADSADAFRSAILGGDPAPDPADPELVWQGGGTAARPSPDDGNDA